MSRRMLMTALAPAVALAVSACAASPGDIPPSYVSPMTFRNWTCDQLAEEGHRLNAAYAVVAKRQEQAQIGDAVGVVLIGLPIASITGSNVAPEISRVKGEHEALYKAAMEKGCVVDGARPKA